MLRLRMLQRVDAEDLIRRLAILEAIIMIAILSALLITSIASNNRLAELQQQSQDQAQQQRENIQRLLEEQERTHNIQTEYLKCLIEKAVATRDANVEFTPEGCDVILQDLTHPTFNDPTAPQPTLPSQQAAQDKPGNSDNKSLDRPGGPSNPDPFRQKKNP